MSDDSGDRPAQCGVEITPEMIEAGKRALVSGFGGETENPVVNYDDVAEAVFLAMLRSARQGRAR